MALMPNRTRKLRFDFFCLFLWHVFWCFRKCYESFICKLFCKDYQWSYFVKIFKGWNLSTIFTEILHQRPWPVKIFLGHHKLVWKNLAPTFTVVLEGSINILHKYTKKPIMAEKQKLENWQEQDQIFLNS